MSKVVEKCKQKQLTKPCDKEGLLPTYESAYKKNFSCKTALVKLFDDLLWSIQQQEVNLLVEIELSVAFHTVDHGILIDMLDSAFNVGGKPFYWFKS